MAKELSNDYAHVLPLYTIQLTRFTLFDVATALQNGLSGAFGELKVDVSSCPCLNRAPFNLAGMGLSGHTSVIVVGSYEKFMPVPKPETATWNIREVLSATSYDSFIIGAGYAAKPYMPYNGHLIMNATYRAPANIMNASRIVSANERTGQRRIVKLTKPSQMMCSFMGNFFVSEGRQGNVIRVRVKVPNSSNVDILTKMQQVLYSHFCVGQKPIVALGGVLRVKNGRVAQNVAPQKYPEQVLSFDDLAKWLQCQEMNLESDLIAVGTIINTKPRFWVSERRYGYFLPVRPYQFHSFSDHGAGGQFIGDTRNDLIEYEGYFNLAEEMHYDGV